MVALSGRTALVTAGSRGIGRAICLKLAEAGVDVGINYHSNHEAAEEVAEQVRARGRRAKLYPFDVSDWKSCQTAVAKALSELGSIDILINNAGLGGSTIGFPSIVDATIEQLNFILGVNLWGTIHMCKLLIEQMREAKRGDIIMISSTLAQNIRPHQGPYTMSKTSVEALAHTLAQEEYPHGIRVNIVAPGFVESDWGEGFIRQHPELRQRFSTFGQLIQPEDVANAVAFLCSEESRFITDQRITVDGGMSTRKPPMSET